MTDLPAVLVLVHRRPELTARTLSALGLARPSRVYVSGDGARLDVPGEEARVEQVWDTVQATTMPCPMFTRRSDVNVGAYRAITTAVSWFLEAEPEGMVLEDDVLIAPDSLTLAEKLLGWGRDRPDAGSVTLFNGVPRSRQARPDATFRGSIITSSQYWGTWRDRWTSYRHDFEDWRSWLPEQRLEDLGGPHFAREWTRRLDDFALTPEQSWDWHWLATHWAEGWSCLTTNDNYSLHLGFGTDATYSADAPRWYPATVAAWRGPFVPPPDCAPDAAADRWMANEQFGLSPAKRVKAVVARYVPSLRRTWRRVSRGQE